MPLDIFVPFWGDPALLRVTVESIVAQTSGDWKLTVIDDCYPDETVPEYFAALDDPRITYLRNETNLGITENYQRCRELASETLLVFMGCDDVMHPNYVETVLAAHTAHPTSAIIQPRVEVIDEHGTVIDPLADRIKRRVLGAVSEPTVMSGEDLAVSLLKGNWLYWPSLTFRRDRLERYPFRDGLPIIQDLALVIDMVLAGESLLVEPTRCFSYRRHTASASAATVYTGKRFNDDRTYFAIAAREARAHGWKRAERAARLRLTSRAHALSLLPGAVARGKVGALRPLLTHAFHR